VFRLLSLHSRTCTDSSTGRNRTATTSSYTLFTQPHSSAEVCLVMSSCLSASSAMSGELVREIFGRRFSSLLVESGAPPSHQLVGPHRLRLGEQPLRSHRTSLFPRGTGATGTRTGCAHPEDFLRRSVCPAGFFRIRFFLLFCLPLFPLASGVAVLIAVVFSFFLAVLVV